MRAALRFVTAALALAMAAIATGSQTAYATTTPDWMRAQVNVPLPAHDDKTDAVLLYSETVVTVQPSGSIKRFERSAYKILRPDGEKFGTVRINFDAQTRITALRGWCIPVNGKDYEVREKDAIESAVLVDHGELISDLRTKLVRIPAATPGSIVGYEVEQEARPYMLTDDWYFQETVPVREAHYSLELPHGWTYKSTWLNHAEQLPTEVAEGKWRWTMSDIKAMRVEEAMPPWRGVAARMVVALQPPNRQDAGMQSWRDIGLWYLGLSRDRWVVSPDIKRQVGELTGSMPTLLMKVQALANFAQNNIRYVAIELGIGGYQPHAATDVFANRFGDCKDKVTLLGVMLKEIGVESHYVVVNTERGSVAPNTPPNLDFNHVVLAIVLPTQLQDASLLAQITHPKLGKILFFDPTDQLTPFGRLDGGLQASYGMLVTQDGGELIQLPKLATTSNAVERTAQMTLDEKGMLSGDIREVWMGDLGAAQRYAMRATTKETDRIKPVERVAAASFASFAILKATVGNANASDQPFEWRYTIEAEKYAKTAGNLLLVRPRVIGTKSSGLLETKEPREHPIEFERPQRDQDVFEIALPSGYEVDELPPAVNVDEGFISYQSKTEVVGRKLRYTRTLEIKELTVPVDKADRLKRLYRMIGDDERNVAVLKRAGT